MNASTPIPVLKPKLVGAELELTTRCPYRCVTCGTSAGTARSDELSFAEWLSAVRDLAELGCKRVTLLGGEPLCFEGWSDVARHATDLGMQVEMVTSGCSVDAAIAGQAREAGLVSVTVSVDGTQHAHDQQRAAQGSFRRALEAIRRFDEAGLRVGVTTQINALSLPTIEDLAQQLQDAGALGWQVQLTFPLGRARHSGIALEPKDMPRLRAVLSRLLERRGLRPFLTDSLGYWTVDDIVHRTPAGGRARPWLQCLAGLRHVGISSDGTVKGCLALWDTFTEGNLRNEALATIWNDPKRFAYTRAFEPSRLSGACADCPHGLLCRGGCTAVAVAYHARPGVSTHCFRLCEPRMHAVPDAASHAIEEERESTP